MICKASQYGQPLVLTFLIFGSNQMTKYFVFRNQSNGAQKNVPGSREEMACEIAKVVSQDALPKDYYIAFAQENKQTVNETLREMATCTVEIDDEREKIWINEAQALWYKFDNLEDQIGMANTAIYFAANDLGEALEQSEHFNDIEYLGPKTVERTFEYMDSSGLSQFADQLSEIFEVEFFHNTYLES